MAQAPGGRPAEVPVEGEVEFYGRLLLFSAAVWLSSGRYDWWRGWLFVALFAAPSLISLPLVRWKNPTLLADRFKHAEEARPFDKVFGALFVPLIAAMVVVSGLDLRHGWTAPLPHSLPVGIALHLAGNIPVSLAAVVNPFLENTVRIQSERGHQVVRRGPYRLVRHPMYLGTLLMAAGWALVLGSRWAFAPYAGLVALLVWRTVHEDRLLQAELPGYREYAAETRWRLVPWIW